MSTALHARRFLICENLSPPLVQDMHQLHDGHISAAREAAAAASEALSAAHSELCSSFGEQTERLTIFAAQLKADANAAAASSREVIAAGSRSVHQPCDACQLADLVVWRFGLPYYRFACWFGSHKCSDSEFAFFAPPSRGLQDAAALASAWRDDVTTQAAEQQTAIAAFNTDLDNSLVHGQVRKARFGFVNALVPITCNSNCPVAQYCDKCSIHAPQTTALQTTSNFRLFRLFSHTW